MSEAATSKPKPQLRVADSAEESARECATYILEALAAVLKSQPRVTLAISGGKTPAPLFSALASSDLDWSKVHFFWVDERCVPPTDGQSNFKLANDTLLAPANVPKYNIHRIRGELVPDEAATRYIEEIKEFFSLESHALPVFDMIHRGIGPDAHTASLFPGEPLIDNRTGIAAAVWVEKLKSHRVTLLPGVLLAARHTVLQVAGGDKADAIRNTLMGPEDPRKYPCQIATRGSENAVWFLDKQAASKL